MISQTIINKLESRTKVFKRELDIEPLRWGFGEVRRVYALGNEILLHSDVPDTANVVGYFIPWYKQDDFMYENDLPCEFFNHELMKVDTNNEESIFSFVSAWGFPYSPAWNMNHIPHIAIKQHAACEQTAELIKAITQIQDEEDCNASSWTHDFFNEYGDIAISLEEAAFTIADLQDAVRSIWEWLENDSKLQLFWVNSGTLVPYELWSDDVLQGVDTTTYRLFGGLTASICNQIVDTVRDEAPWRKCACEGCDVIFKRKQGAKRPNADSIYCCKPCEELQKKRNQIAAAKNRIKH